MARICGALIALGYFLPWVDVIIISFSGYNIGKIVDMAGEFGARKFHLPCGFMEPISSRCWGLRPPR